LKEIADKIVPPLAALHNESLRVGIIPSAWKQSNITPVHKGGKIDDPNKYRPTAVVSVVAKVFESPVILVFGVE